MKFGFASDDEEDDNEFPLGKDYWTIQGEDSSIYESDPYTTTMYIPFVEKTVEFGFLNGTSKTVTFDESDRFNSPKQKEVGNIQREEYYTFDEVQIGYFRKRPNKHIADIMLSTSYSNEPKIIITTPNHLYTEPKKTREMVAVIKATVKDIYSGTIMKWKLLDVESIERVSKENAKENDIRYPTEGAVPEYLNN